MQGVARLAVGLVVGFPVMSLPTLEREASPGVPPEQPVTDTYWGETIVDPFQNLETLDDPVVTTWLTEQNTHARARLDAYPARDAIEQRVASLSRTPSSLYADPRVMAGRTFFLEIQAQRAQPSLVAFDDVQNRETRVTLVDPTLFDPSGRTAIDFYSPSLDGRLVAVSLSVDGTEAGVLHLFDTRSGSDLGLRIPGVYSGTAGGSVAWDAGGEGFLYTRNPVEAGAPDAGYFDQRVYHHTIGSDPRDDPMVLGDGLPAIAKIDLTSSADGRHQLACITFGDGGPTSFRLREPTGSWRTIAGRDDLAEHIAFGPDDALYVLSGKGAPTHAISRMPMSSPSVSAAEVVVEAGVTIIADFAVTESRIYVVEMLEGISRLRVYGLDGTPLDLVEMGEISRVAALTARRGNEVLFRNESYLTPPTWFLYSPSRRRPSRTALVHEPRVEFADIEVRLEHAIADDGTAVPITVLAPRALVRNGHAPALLRGYGAYGISLEPTFDATNRLWFDQGGVLAFAHVRGGGELGDDWHRAATLENKQRSVDDFALCARHLIAAGYTSPERLAIEGGSAGGLLVYAAMALYPHRFGAVVAHAGVADVLRSELTPNGRFNVPEFGTVENERHFRGMYSYSPYHNLFDGESYPAVLSLVGLNDVRVEPWHAMKMTARLLATGTSRPVLLHVNGREGHDGTRLSDRDRARADVFTFLLGELDIEFRASAAVATADRADPRPTAR